MPREKRMKGKEGEPSGRSPGPGRIRLGESRAGQRARPPGAKGEAMTGAKFNKIPTKFPILRGGYRREARISLLNNISAAKRDKTRPKMDAFKKVLVGEAAERCVFGLKRLIPPQQGR